MVGEYELVTLLSVSAMLDADADADSDADDNPNPNPTPDADVAAGIVLLPVPGLELLPVL